MKTTLIVMVVSLGAFVASVHPTHAQTAVTTCGQVIDGDAYLGADLDCGPGTQAAVQLHAGGSLDLRGFGIHGGEYGVLCADDAQNIGGVEVFPYAPCRVFGSGTIDGQSVVGIVASVLDLADVTVSSDAIALIIHKRLSFTNAILQLGPIAGGSVGIETGDKIPIEGTGLTVTGGAVGIQGGRIKIDNVTASGYGVLIMSASLYENRVELSRASLTGGTRGIVGAGLVTLTDSTVTGHSSTAIQASRIKLIGSSVTGNGLDLSADSRPRLVSGSTCQTSNGWGVCTNDH